MCCCPDDSFAPQQCNPQAELCYSLDDAGEFVPDSSIDLATFDCDTVVAQFCRKCAHENMVLYRPCDVSI